MADLNEFSKRISTIAVKVEANTATTVRKVALVADQAVVSATPVDTGRARSNWLAQLDSAAVGVRRPYAEGKRLGTGERENAEGAMRQASSVISRYTNDNKEIHITNNLPYIAELNRGSSKQAPANFVEAGVAAASRAVQGAKLVEGNS